MEKENRKPIPKKDFTLEKLELNVHPLIKLHYKYFLKFYACKNKKNIDENEMFKKIVQYFKDNEKELNKLINYESTEKLW